MLQVTPRLAPLRLPMMESTQRGLRELLGKASARNPDLQPLILKDPGAAVALFRLLAELRPEAADQITDVSHAISLLGFAAIERLLRETELAAAGKDNTSRAIALAYGQAAHAAHFARVLGEQKHLAGPDELATSALLQQPALLALAIHEPEDLLRAGSAVRQGVPAEIALQAELGESLNHANRSLARHWGLPHLAREAMDNQDMLSSRSIPVRLAGDLALSMSFGCRSQETQTLVALCSNFLHQPVDRVGAWLRSEAAAAARELYPLGYPCAAFECLLLPSAETDEEPEELKRLWARRGRPRGAQAAAAAVAAPAQTARPDLQQILNRIMQQIREHAGMGRVMFLLLGKDRQQLRARLLLGADKGDPLRRFAMPVGGKDLFSLLLNKPQSIRVNAANLVRYQAHLTPPLDQLPSSKGWFAMSLFVGKRPLGVLYADGGRQSDRDYQRFRQLVQLAANSLGGGSQAA